MPVPVITPLAFDNFAGANQSPIGLPWSGLSANNAQRLNNQFCPKSTASAQACQYIYSGSSWPTSQFVQAILKNLVSGEGVAALIVRGQNSGGPTFYYAGIDASGSGGIGKVSPFHVWEVNGGDFEGVIDPGGFTVIPQIGDVFTLVISQANLIQCFQNGNLILSFTNKDIPSGGSGGLYLDASTTLANVLDLAWGGFVGGRLGVVPGNPVAYTTVEVGSPGTPAAAAAAPINCNAIFFEALSTNVGKVYVGLSGMSKSTLAGCLRVLLPPPSTPLFLDNWNPQSRVSAAPLDLSTIFIDADTQSDGVLISYLVC